MLERKDIELAFYSKIIDRYDCEKAMFEIFGVVTVNWINYGKYLTIFSKIWTEIEKRRIFYKNNKKMFRNYWLRIVELMIEGVAKIYDSIHRYFYRINEYDFYFSPRQQAPKYILKNNKIIKVIVLHDTIAFMHPEYFPRMNNKYQKHWVKELVNSMNNDELFLANSYNTRTDFLALKKELNPNRIRVVYHACSNQFTPCVDKIRLSMIKQKYHIAQDKKYVFSLCTIEPRKNLIRIVKTFIEFIKKNQIKDLILILGGGTWDSFIKEFEYAIGEIEGFSEIVYRVGYIDDEDLPLLYSGAFFFVYTSQYEGFGVPPLEAMKCGCPVIASNNSSIPEVVDNAGILIEWSSDKQHIEAYEKYYFDEEYRRVQAQNGLIQSHNFSWEKTVENIINEMKKEW